jgi:hypothetical protein
MSNLRSLLVVVLVAACSKSEPADSKAHAAPSTAAPTPSPAPAPAAKPVEAPPYTSAAGKFTQRVTFGAASEKELPDPNGGAPWKTTIWKLPSAHLMVQYADYPSHAAAVAEIKAFIPTRDASEIKRDEAVTIGGHEGREIEWASNATTTMWMRLLVADKRVYKVGGGFKGDRADIQKFIDGLSIDAPAK